MTPEEVARILTNPDRLAGMYDALSMEDMSRALSVSRHVVSDALAWAGIARRKSGHMPPHPERSGRYLDEPAAVPDYLVAEDWLATVRLRTWCAYLKLSRCPIACPESTNCDRINCLLEKQMIAAGHLEADYWRQPEVQAAFRRYIRRSEDDVDGRKNGQNRDVTGDKDALSAGGSGLPVHAYHAET